VRYVGPYRTDRVPALTPLRRREPDVVAYGTAKEPKAMAIHPLGRVFVVAHAQTPYAAEQEALRQCNADPGRGGAAGPCFLYAVGNRVVLPGRHIEPLAADPNAPKPAASTPAAPGQTIPPISPNASGNAPGAPLPPTTPTGSPRQEPPSRPQAEASQSSPDGRAVLLSRMVETVPFVSRANAETLLGTYLAEPGHRAFAVVPDRGETWRVTGAASPEQAEELVLERCQLRYRVPCLLFAVDDTIRAPAAGADWQRRDMARLHAPAEFDAERIPAIATVRRQAPGVSGYAEARARKAMAIHPWGRVFIVTGAATQEKAEEEALAACDADPRRAGRDGPCLLYASGDRVVLAEHRTGAGTPTANRRVPLSPERPAPK
jgi:hypothetical protein